MFKGELGSILTLS